MQIQRSEIVLCIAQRRFAKLGTCARARQQMHVARLFRVCIGNATSVNVHRFERHEPHTHSATRLYLPVIFIKIVSTDYLGFEQNF